MKVGFISKNSSVCYICVCIKITFIYTYHIQNFSIKKKEESTKKTNKYNKNSHLPNSIIFGNPLRIQRVP